MDVPIRWLIRKDMPQVIAIENLCFPNPWQDEDFMCCLRSNKCIGMVSENLGTVYGYMLYELHKRRLVIINFAVHPEWQRCGIGRSMVDKLKDKLSQQRRNELLVEVRESNLVAQQFFREMRFRAVSVLRNHYEDTDEDAYLFRFRLDEQIDDGPFALRNRIQDMVTA